MRRMEERRIQKQRQEWEEAANPDHKLHEVYEMVKQSADEQDQMRLFQRLKRVWTACK